MAAKLALRGVDRQLERRIREEAKAADVLLNKAALRLLRRGAGLDRAGASSLVGGALDHLIGTWTEAEARELAEATRVFERVDEDVGVEDSPPRKDSRRPSWGRAASRG